MPQVASPHRWRPAGIISSLPGDHFTKASFYYFWFWRHAASLLPHTPAHAQQWATNLHRRRAESVGCMSLWLSKWLSTWLARPPRACRGNHVITSPSTSGPRNRHLRLWRAGVAGACRLWLVRITIGVPQHHCINSREPFHHVACAWFLSNRASRLLGTPAHPHQRLSHCMVLC